MRMRLPEESEVLRKARIRKEERELKEKMKDTDFVFNAVVEEPVIEQSVISENIKEIAEEIEEELTEEEAVKDIKKRKYTKKLSKNKGRR